MCTKHNKKRAKKGTKKTRISRAELRMKIQIKKKKNGNKKFKIFEGKINGHFVFFSKKLLKISFMRIKRTKGIYSSIFFHDI